MSTNVGAIDLDLILNSKSFKNQLNTAVNSSLKSVNKTASGTLTTTFSKLGKLVAGAFAVKQIVKFGSECVKLGSDLAEVQNVVDVTFGSMSGKVDEFAKSAITSVGLSETVAKKYMGQYGAMAKAFGYGTDKAYDMSETLTKLTGDVASFYNLSTDEAQTKLKSVFTGETESLKELGVVMTQTALDEFALAKGYGKTTAAMSEQEKVALRLAFVTDRLSDASGDFARTSDGWANQTRVLSLRFDALKATLGQGLINALTPAIRVLNQLMAYLQKAADAFSDFTARVFGKQEASASASASATADLAGNMGDVGEAATQSANAVKKAQKSLAGFDKLNVIGSGSSGASAGGASTPSVTTPSGSEGNTTEEVKQTIPLLDTIKKKMQELTSLFTKGFSIGFDSAPLDDLKLKLSGVKEHILGIFQDENVQNAGSGFISKFAESAGKSMGSLASIGTTICDLVFGSIDTYFNQNGGRVKQHFVNMFDISGETVGIVSNFHTVLADIASVFSSPDAQQIGADIINIFSEPLMTAQEICAKFGRDVLSVITGPIVDNADSIKLAFSNTLAPIRKMTSAVSRNVTKMGETMRQTYDEYIAPAFQNIREGFSKIVSSITNAYNTYLAPVIDYLAEKFVDLWDNHIGPMAQKVIGFIGKVCELVGVVWNNYIAPFIAWLVANIIPKIAPIIQTIGSIISGIAATVADVIGGIFSALGGLIDFLTGVFTGDWEKAWNGIKDFVSGIWDAIWAAIKGVINLVIDGLNLLWSNVYKVFKGVVDGIGGAVGWVGDLFGKDWGFSMPENPPMIPKLAQGGYVEANTPQLAMIGDNRHEGEIVAPESKITEAVMAAMGPIVEVIRQLGASIKAMQSSGGNITVQCVLDGKILYETVVKQDKIRRRQGNGKSPLTI